MLRLKFYTLYHGSAVEATTPHTNSVLGPLPTLPLPCCFFECFTTVKGLHHPLGPKP